MPGGGWWWGGWCMEEGGGRYWWAAVWATIVEGWCASPMPGMDGPASSIDSSVGSKLVFVGRVPLDAFSTGPWPRAPPSRGISPGRLRHQNLAEQSLLPEQSRCPRGWNWSDHTGPSCAPRASAWGLSWPTTQCSSDPSCPPDTKSSSCSGCQVTAVTSLFCPRYVLSTFITRMSNTLQVWSREPVSSQLPLLFHFTQPTVCLCPCTVATHFPVLGSHSFADWSFEAEARSALHGCQSTPFTSLPCPEMVTSVTHFLKSQILTVVSSEHEQNLRSVGLKESPRTASRCAGITFTWLKFDCQYFTLPVSSPVISQFSLWLYVIARMACPSCAITALSKLKH
mmetsp:Transcript_2398/g.4897  ORF Transcript_2398/g.4897 Transcript_2398/m.4897 type:complete len:340 (+) Transcript_2398:133-1152(+)